jgi:hypothetical protein
VKIGILNLLLLIFSEKERTDIPSFVSVEMERGMKRDIYFLLL